VNALKLYHDLKERGVILEAQGENLKVDAPVGVVTEDDRAALLGFKPKLLEFLSRPKAEPQTTTQILRCLTLGMYTVAIEDGELEIRGPQPLAGPLPDSIKTRRDELVSFLNEWGDGAWPPASGSKLRELQRLLGCGVSAALDVVEASQRRAG